MAHLRLTAVCFLIAIATALTPPPTSSNSVQHSSRGLTISDIYMLGQSWTIASKDNACFIPVIPAAIVLEDFYQTLLEYALSTNRRETNALSISSGVLQLAISCRQSAIPWVFVQNYARRMIDMTRLGYTGRYFTVMFHPSTATEIILALYVVKELVRGQ